MQNGGAFYKQAQIQSWLIFLDGDRCEVTIVQINLKFEAKVLQFLLCYVFCMVSIITYLFPKSHVNHQFICCFENYMTDHISTEAAMIQTENDLFVWFSGREFEFECLSSNWETNTTQQ